MIINLVADNSVANAAAGFTTAMQTAASILGRAFSDNITINLRYGWGSYNNVADATLVNSGGAYAQAQAGDNTAYSTVRSWLASDVVTDDDATSVNALPANNNGFPTPQNIFVTSAQERALGHFAGAAGTIDGAAAFGTGTTAANWVGIALHEFTHAIGRLTAFYEASTTPVVLDLFRYSSTGVRQWTGGNAAYFSVDNGATHLASYGTSNDYSDLLNNVANGNDSFNEFYNASTYQTLTETDLRMMDVIGFNRRDDFVENQTTAGHVTVGGAAVQGFIETALDRDWISVNLQSGVRYQIALSGTGANQGTLSDAFLTLRDSNGVSLASDDDSGPGLDSLLFYTAPATATYYIEARGVGQTTGTYHASVAVVPVGSISIGSASIVEGNAGTSILSFLVTRAGGSAPFSVNYATANGTAVAGSDFVANAGVLTFGANINSQTISIVINGDTKFENNETFSVNLSGATNGGNIAAGTATGTIFNDDINRSRADFNGDGTSDILWRNSSGYIGSYSIANGQASQWNGHAALGTDWNVAATGDFNNDGTSDVLLRRSDGYLGAWSMLNGAIDHWTGLSPLGTDWNVAATGDFNNDGTSDVLLRRSDGYLGAWSMLNGAIDHWTGLSPLGTDWSVAATGDFNNDGTSDILLRRNDGYLGTWSMLNGAIDHWTGLAALDTSWSVAATTGDFNSDGTSDVLLRRNDGYLGTWSMKNGTIDHWTGLGAFGADWSVAGTGDFNRDGTADILLRRNDGYLGILSMLNGAVDHWTGLAPLATSWSVAATGDYNGDGASDILLRDTAGNTGIWEIANSAIVKWDSLGVVDPSWAVAGK